jgi:8-oxo-dGTP pyrophosphatase MutT (NUDIX family)
MTRRAKRESEDDDWRARIAANLSRASAQRVRSLFSEINPGLVGDKLFESRWSEARRDAAVLIPIVDRPEGPSVVLTVRSAETPTHSGQISFPGGRVEAGDRNAIETALREAEEEIALARRHVRVIGALGVHNGGIGFAVTPIVAVVDPTAEFVAAPREVAEIFEVPLAFIADLRNHVMERRVHEGVDYNMFAAPYGRYHIWGLTAGILRTLAETLQNEETAFAGVE